MRSTKALILAATFVAGGPLRASTANGIHVSAPKVYEERTLRAMLEQAEAQLASLRPISGTKVESAIGAVQGVSQSSSVFSLTATGVAQPAVDTQTTQGRVDGNLTTTGVIETEKVAGAAPAAPSAPTASAFTPTGYGLSARDLLSEQVALSYQIASLRLALERAASDRLNSLDYSDAAAERHQADTTTVPRRPVVLGFTIGIDRPPAGAVAEIDITLDLDARELREDLDADAARKNPGITLIAVLPTKEAYNVAAVTERGANIGAGQVVSAFQLGAGFFGSRKTYYIVRDADTVSTFRRGDEPNQIHIGWQFRPVLGRKVVESGPRQVWVVLGIDDTRYDTAGFSLSASATTRWSRIGRGGVVGRKGREQNEPPVSLGYWQVFTSEQLQPWVQRADLIPLSSTRGLVTVSGHFFSPESKVLVNDLTIDRSNGLTFNDEDAISLVLPLLDVARADDLHLMNRYLAPTPIRRRDAKTVTKQLSAGDLPCSASELRLEGHCCVSRKPVNGRYTVRAKLEGDPLPRLQDLLALAGDTVVSGAATARTDRFGEISVLGIRWTDFRPLQERDPKPQSMEVAFELPTSALREGTDLRIKEVFGGPSQSLRCALPPVTRVDRIVALEEKGGDGAKHTLIAIQGRALSRLEHIRQGTTTLDLLEITDDLALALVPSAIVKGPEVLLLETKDEELILAPLAKPKAEVKKPVFSTLPAVMQHFSGPVSIPGDGFDDIRAVLFEGKALEMKVDGKNLVVHLVSTVTEHAATRALTVRLSDDSTVPLTVTVRPTG